METTTNITCRNPFCAWTGLPAGGLNLRQAVDSFGALYFGCYDEDPEVLFCPSCGNQAVVSAEDLDPIDVEEWEADPAKPGYLRLARTKTIREVEKALIRKLRAAGLLEESFGAFPSVDRSRPFPKGRIACFAVTGANEGHYVHVQVLQRGDDPRVDFQESRLVFLGKTFSGWAAAWRMAETCARLLGA